MMLWLGRVTISTTAVVAEQKIRIMGAVAATASHATPVRLA